MTTCLYPNCQREPVTRGLCPNHYSAARRYVKLGKTTWDALVASGKCEKPKNRSGADRAPNWFLEPPQK